MSWPRLSASAREPVPESTPAISCAPAADGSSTTRNDVIFTRLRHAGVVPAAFDDVLGGRRAPRPRFVQLDLWRLLQNRRHHSPCLHHGVLASEQCLVAVQRFVYQ